jgi:hypothetical protein
MNGDLENFNEVVAKGEALYKTFTDIWCPYFNDKVYFNSGGLEHLKFKRRDHSRPRHDQYMRFKLLHYVPEIIKQSKTVQGIWDTKKFERVRSHNRVDHKLVTVTYFEFIAVIERVRIKIVVKQIENGQRHFWSIIPFWGMNRETKKRKLYAGNPEED